jgi:hypothetical protein
MTEKPNGEDPPTPERTLDPKIEAMIGAKLRSYYDSLMSEAVPDRIVELLMQLDAKERAKQPESR